MLLMALLLAVCAISVGFCGSRMGAGIARDLRRDIFAKVTSFTNNEYDKFGTASLITRSTNDVTQVQGLVTMGLRIMCYAPIIGIGGTIMALSKSVSMAWVIALAVVLILGLICTISAIAMPRFKIMQQLVDKLNLVSRENLSGMMVIRAFATQDFEEKRFDKANKDLADNNLFVFRAMATMMPVMMLVMNGVSLLIVWVGGHQIADSAMQVGDMMAFIQYTMQIIMSFLMISMMFVMVPRASVSAGRIADVLASESSVQDAPQPRHLPEKVKGLVQFNDVSFHYEGADENVLEHVTFTARPGETTAFIGSTGSGKSTLINLIPRFTTYRPAASQWTAWTFATSHSMSCATPLVMCRRKACCSAGTSAPICVTAARTPTRMCCAGPPRWPRPRNSSTSCRTALKPPSVKAAPMFRADSASVFPSPARW